MKYFNGTVVEQAFSNGTLANDTDMFACLPCQAGCETCESDRPCIVVPDDSIRYSVLGVTLLSIVMCFGITVFIWRCREVKVMSFTFFLA